MQFANTEDKFMTSAKMATTIKRQQIFSGDIKAAELQIRNDLDLGPNDRIFFLDEKKQPWIPQLNEIKLDPCEPIGSVCRNIFRHKLVTYFPVYFDNEQSSLWGYLYLEQEPASNWGFAMLLTAFFFLVMLIQNIGFYTKTIREISRVSTTLTDWSVRMLKNPKAPSLSESAPFQELQPVEYALSQLTHEIVNLESIARNEGALTTLRAIGHDILNPVSRIKRILGIIRTEKDATFLDEDDLFLNLNRNVKRLSDYAEQLKFMYKRDIGELSVDVSSTNVSREIKSLIAEMRFDPDVIDRNVTITSSIDDDCVANIPAAPLGRMVENICANGIHATKEFGSIHVGVSSKEDTIIIDVNDSGSGIPEHLRQKVFEAGFTSKPNKGTGLGLFVVKQICDQYGGKIDMETTPGIGTSIRIALPRKEIAHVI
jgi:signal transduction histidine kinase